MVKRTEREPGEASSLALEEDMHKKRVNAEMAADRLKWKRETGSVDPTLGDYDEMKKKKTCTSNRFNSDSS